MARPVNQINRPNQINRRVFLAAPLTIPVAAALLERVAQGQQTADDDVILRAMRDELARSRQLRVAGENVSANGANNAGANADDVPYFISYSLDDGDTFTVLASLGSVTESLRDRTRSPLVEVRVGSYDFDNTGHVFSGYYDGSRYDTDPLPLDDDYQALRERFWLATDHAFKAAIESIARKRASLNGAVAQAGRLPDYSKAESAVSLEKVARAPLDEKYWTERIAKLSGLFLGYPRDVLASNIEFHANLGTTYLVNTEGTAIRYRDDAIWLWVRAEGQASDGMFVRECQGVTLLSLDKTPSDAELEKMIHGMAGNVQALVHAPVGDAFTGPVLFEPLAAAQLLAQQLGDNLRPTRKPVMDPRRPVNLYESEFQGRMGGRVFPEWMEVVDDPTQTTWQGHTLTGGYPFDMEGVRPVAVKVIEKGVLKAFLATRQPVKNALVSNGHARLLGGFGTHSAAIGNLFVKANETAPLAELKARMIQLCKDRDLPYGLLIRKLDFPFSGNNAEINSLQATSSQSGGSLRPVSPPMLAYKIYPDGREELVRGLRFKGVRTRSLRDILAASSESAAFDYINNGAPLARAGVGGYIAPTSVVAPGLLFDELELDGGQEQLEKPPIVPPPNV